MQNTTNPEGKDDLYIGKKFYVHYFDYVIMDYDPPALGVSKHYSRVYGISNEFYATFRDQTYVEFGKDFELRDGIAYPLPLITNRKTDAVEFAEWLGSQFEYFNFANGMWYEREFWDNKKINKEPMTTPDLYEIFLREKDKVK